MAWENFLARLDQNTRTPMSVVTVAEFIEKRFRPEHVALLRPAGQAHYGYMLEHVVGEGGIGELRLRDVTTADVQRLVSAILARTYEVARAAGADGKPRPPLRRRSPGGGSPRLAGRHV